MDPELKSRTARAAGLSSRLYADPSRSSLHGFSPATREKSIGSLESAPALRRQLGSSGRLVSAQSAPVLRPNLSKASLGSRSKSKIGFSTSKPREDKLLPLPIKRSTVRLTHAAEPPAVESDFFEDASYLSHGTNATATTFLSGLQLTADQMARFIEDPGNFLYLGYRQGTSGMAYDLQVVDHDGVNPSDYYTLSCNGLTHFTGNTSEFTPMNRWEREFHVFNEIRAIPFFAKYRKWKNFAVWKRNVKRAKIHGATEGITGRLFVFVPILRDALLHIKTLCSEVGSRRLLDAAEGKTYTLEEFVQAQGEIQEEFTVELSNFSSNIHSTVKSSCDKIVDEFLAANNIQAEHKMTFMERASLRSECRKLTRFLKLTDFIVVDTLRDLAFDSMDHAIRMVNPTTPMPRVVFSELPEEKKDDGMLVLGDEGPRPEDYCPLFTVHAEHQPDDDMLVVSPGLEDFKGMFAAVIHRSLGVVGIPERVSNNEELSAYIMTDGGDGDEPGAIHEPVHTVVSKDIKFQTKADEIFRALDVAFAAVEDYTQVFSPYRNTFKENSEYIGTIKERYKEINLDFYRSEISKFGGMKDEFTAIPAAAKVLIFNVNSWGLKQMLMPSPLQCLFALQTLLPELIHERASTLSEKLGELLPIIERPPQDVERFVKRKKVVMASAEEMESLKERQGLVQDMQALVKEQNWALTDTIKALLIMIDDNMVKLENGIQKAEATQEEDMKRFAADVEAEVPVMKKKISELRTDLENDMISDTEQRAEGVIAFLEQKEDIMQAHKTRSEELQDYQGILGLDVTEYEVLDEVVSDLNLKLKLWRGVKEWSTLTAEWEQTPLREVDSDTLERKVNMFNKTAFQATKGLPSNPVAPALKDKVSLWTPVLPVVVDLRNPSLKDRHWDQIHELIGFEIKDDVDFALVDLIRRKVTDRAEDITNIATSAVQEGVLEEMMGKVSGIWETTELVVNPYKDTKGLFVLGDVSEIVASLDDSLVTVNTVLGSRYVSGIRGFVEKWRADLILFQDTLDEWLTCQRGWMYLETIFSSPDIVRQLPSAAKMFQAVDKSWKTIMKHTAEEPLAIRACTVKDRKELFQSHNAALDKIQKNLEEYLETKRAKFPRFYFLSNDELLEILSQSKDPQAVQPHLPKCFEALTRLDFGDEPESVDIYGMYSPEGERVDLGKHLKARGSVEDWLTGVEQRMKQSLHQFMKAGLIDYDTKPRHEWVLCHPGQVVATVAQMTWARGTELAIRASDPSEGLDAWYKLYVGDLLKLIEAIRTDLKKIVRKIIVALVTTDVHARDIIEQLADEKVSDTSNFTWQMQLRYYWEDVPVDDCIIKHSDARINYGYEYMGATSRLVITPLTDRCWMTLTGAYGLKLGAAPAGPAGTGKTESSKDLAKAMGILCIVFNCSDQIDYKMMGKLFRGLAQAGCWTCLDEFNRIDIEVLSVIAQQMQLLKEGRVMGKSTINFMGVEILLRDHHVIITMNPGYAGRTELPDNLQVCFRPVAMMVPNYALIAEIMLFAEGFGDAKTLARKMCKLYILCSEQLSQQPHYDYGLRAVKSVLVMAGSLKRANPDINEDLVLIRALRDSNQPKFLADDIPLFQAIILDLFPGTSIPPNEYGEFQTVMEEQIRSNHHQTEQAFMNKIIQMFDIFQIRFGATLVGPTGSGKTTIYRTLAAIMSELRSRGSSDQRYQTVRFQILNPKCISMGELYGEMNELTQEWHDGLASTIMRGFVAETSEDRRWTVFDGPIDALWIENMNTVLDDNMTLCLANGERIKLKAEMKCLFEVQDLAVASPATVSRIGVVYVSPTDLGWFPTVVTWASTQLPQETPQGVRDHIMDLVGKLVQPGLKFQRKNCKEPVKCTDVQLTTSLSFIFQSLFLSSKGVDFSLGEDLLKKVAEKLFVFAFVWSVGGSIDNVNWRDFDEFTRETLDSAGVNVGLPPTETVFDYFVDFAPVAGDEGAPRLGEFVNWQKIIPEFQFNPNASYFDLFVPNADTVRFSYLMTHMIEQHKPVFLTGLTGTGKTAMVTKLLKDLEPLQEDGGLGLSPVFINYSAQTSSLVTQLTIEGKLEKKRKNLLGAPVNRKMLVFVDDVNMPLVETYGAQAPVELLRQFLDHKGFYDRDKLFWKDIQDTLMFTGAAPPGGGRNEVTPRFVRHFNVFCVPPASDESMALIFRSILHGFLAKFDGEIKKIADGVVQGTIETYNRISTELLPTPSKFHYTFNLRDISKVFQGILMVSPKKIKTVETFAKLWMHETLRVFADRLTNTDDLVWFESLLLELQARSVGTSFSAEDIFQTKPILFVDFLKPGADPTFYEECPDINKVTAILNDSLDEYNITFPTQMNLVFFADAVKHVARCSRVLRQPRGNSMLVGVGGSGKQSTTRMAAFIAGMDCVQIEIVRGYKLADFREDIKSYMVRTGVEGQPTVFLFTDSQIVVETMLEDINNVLNSGEIPNLFPQDEMDKIVGDMIPICKELGVPETRDNCITTFIKRSRENLHIVLCMSPVGDALRIRCRQFPSLINCTTIDWYQPWPESALVAVAERYLSGMELPSEDIRGGLVQLCGYVHTSVKGMAEVMFAELMRRTYTTPKSYLDLIALYMAELGRLQSVVVEKTDQMKIGVKKLEETNAVVDGLREELKALEPVLEAKSVEAEAMLKQVAIDQADADEMKEKVEVDVAQVEKQQAAVSEVAADAQRDLDIALPALKNAVKALDSLTKADIVEVKTFKTPPALVKTVMEAICIMLDAKPDWDSAKKVLGDGNFLGSLKGYNKDDINPTILKKIEKYVKDPEFSPDNVGKVSKAAQGLCLWVHAMDVYSKVAKEVEPKKAKLAKLNSELAVANEKLSKKQAELQAVVDKVAELQRQCDETTAEKERLQYESDQTAVRLTNAEKLTSGLSSEGVRWKETVASLAVQKVNLIGDTFLSCAAISYYGPFTGNYRDRLVQQWLSRAGDLGVPASEVYSLMQTMGNPVTIREWQNFSLPTDEVSTNSAILVATGKRWPLMIDPQGQANKWLKQMEERQDMSVTKMNDINLLRSLENCIRVGKPLLIEDIGEKLEPALEPVLQRATFKEGNRVLIRLGDQNVDYDDHFKLYMTTKMPNPHYLPEVCIKVTIVNFTVTMDGLEDQLLGDVVKKERPDVEERKVKLLLQMAADKKKLAEIEAEILYRLSNAEGNILDDVVLIDTLATSKKTSSIIKDRVAESEKTEVEINEARNQYRRAATRGSIIYFVIADLAQIDPMYQYSLEYYAALFGKCIDDSEPSEDLDKRLDNLINYATGTIYENICRGLFERHKILFSALVCFQILRQRGAIAADEWGLVIRGPGAVDRTDQPKNPAPDKISEQAWDLLYAAETRIVGPAPAEGGDSRQPFAGLCASVTKQWRDWSAWMAGDDLTHTAPPAPYDSTLTRFMKLILIKAFRDDQLIFALQDYVANEMGTHMAQSPATSMADVYRDLDNKTPCIFILSKGADPTGMLVRFAKEMGYGDRLHPVSLGQGQGPYAQKLIEGGCRSGDWVLLQNCMLAKSWMGSLEDICFDLQKKSEENHADFRLYLTSAPAPYFPVSVLQNGVKMTNEPPNGVRNNVSRSFKNLIKDEYWESCRNPAYWKKILCGLVFFHANIQERRKFGPLGWNIRYAFDESDLETSIAIMRRFLDEQDEFPWDAMRYVTGQINYGGRVTDDQDRRCLMTILSKHIHEDILNDGYKFSVSGTYYAPPIGPLSAVHTYFDQLPASDDPEIFGMHPNANTTYNRSISSELMFNILVLQPRTSGGGGGGKSSDEIVLDLLAAMKEKVPELLTEDEAGPVTFVIQENGLLPSLAIVLQQEMVKFNRLTNCMASTIRDLNRAINGLIVMSPDLDAMYTSCMNNQVPAIWSKVSFASLKSLASWVKDLNFRVDFMRVWLQNGLPASFPLPVFFFPQGFMTGTLQTYARKYQVAIDTLTFKYELLCHASPECFEEGPDDGVYIYGLFLEGARFDRDLGMLQPSFPGIMFEELPPVHFQPAVGHRPAKEDYQCPVYKTSERKGVLSTTGMSTNYVVSMDIKTDIDPGTWVMYGVAALCNLTD